jgi:type IV conjugative transfer system coupling protein TraD
MGFFKTIAEGGQIWAHRVRMLRQVIRIAVFASLTIGIVFFADRMAQIPTVYYQAAWYYGKAQLLGSVDDEILVSSKFWSKIEKYNHSGKTIGIRSGKLEQICKRKLIFLWRKTKSNLTDAGSLIFKIFGLSILFFLAKGLIARRKRHVTGQKRVPPWQIALRLKLGRNASPFKLDTMPLVKGSETRHILISGATGSGKTNCFHTLLPQIRRKRQRGIIVDTSGEFVSKYFREGKDFLLNPFDKRGVQWHPWCECHDSFAYKTLAQSFIPSSHNEDENFWRKSAQEVFSSILEMKAVERKISEVVKLLLYLPLPQLYKALQNTKAASFLDTTSERTSGSIRAVAASFLECLELFEDTETPFSIRDWVQKGTDDSWLFLSSTIGQRASMTPLISAWFSTAMRSLLQMEPNMDRRLWLIADELPSLNRLRDLETCLSESRKFGGCAMLALQSPAQLEMVYGRELTRIIIGNCATRIAFAEQDPEIAARISKTFGEKEMQEFQESISYGAHEMRDGVNLSSHSKVSPVVSATEIQSLDTHQAFVKIPGNFPITKIKLSYQAVPKICAPFVKKNEALAQSINEASDVIFGSE